MEMEKCAFQKAKQTTTTTEKKNRNQEQTKDPRVSEKEKINFWLSKVVHFRERQKLRQNKKTRSLKGDEDVIAPSHTPAAKAKKSLRRIFCPLSLATNRTNSPAPL